jgi:hypothetical protein
MPSVITGSKIAPLSEQIQKGTLDTGNLVDNSPLLNKTESLGNKQGSARNLGQGVEAILVKNVNRNASREKTVKFASKIDMVDTLKGEVKVTRQRIDILANGQ